MEVLFNLAGSIITSCLTYYILLKYLEIKPAKFKKAVLFLACFLLNEMIVYVGDVANMPPTFLIFLFAIHYSCDGSFKKKLTIGFSISTAPFALNCLIDSFLFWDNYSPLALATEQLIEISFWIILFILVRNLKIPNNFDLPNKYWNTLLLIACIPFLILLSIIVIPSMNESFPKSINATLICILVIIILSVVGILYAISALYKASMLEQQQFLFEMNDKYYKNIDSQMSQIRQLRHDMVNHLQVLSNMPESEIKNYVNQLMDSSSLIKPISFCRDSVINALINLKYDSFEKNNIRFTYEISLEDDHSLTPTDLCALIGNLLDNAIEGCVQVTDSRFITLKIACSKGVFVLDITNSCKDNIDISKTSKKDAPADHGFGIKSINSIVQKNKGTIHISHEHGTFNVFVVIPVSS